MSARSYHTCGVRQDGSVACWGNSQYDQVIPPNGEFASISAGQYHNCGVKLRGSVACWDRNDAGQEQELGLQILGLVVGLADAVIGVESQIAECSENGRF